jgi:long-chain acyl-CoA synthetase
VGFLDLNLQDIRFLMEDIQELKPTAFCGVPKVYDCIYAGIFISVLYI